MRNSQESSKIRCRSNNKLNNLVWNIHQGNRRFRNFFLLVFFATAPPTPSSSSSLLLLLWSSSSSTTTTTTTTTTIILTHTLYWDPGASPPTHFTYCLCSLRSIQTFLVSHWRGNWTRNKKVLLRKRKRHATRHVAGAHYAALSNEGVPHPVLAGGEGVPHPVLARWGYPIQSWPGGYPI